MKYLIVLMLLVAGFCPAAAQKMTVAEWDKEAETNIRLLPKYGGKQKTEGQKQSDAEFIAATMKTYTDKRKASDHLIELGFQYLYRDIKTAMYRFNQAYLLDPSNPEIYWGFGGVYMTLGDNKRAERAYKDGLAMAPNNPHLLTDYGAYFMAQYYAKLPSGEKAAEADLNAAISYLLKSYKQDKKYPSTNYKLAMCYYGKRDCKNAWRYYKECAAISSMTIDAEFTTALEEMCGGG